MELCTLFQLLNLLFQHASRDTRLVEESIFPFATALWIFIWLWYKQEIFIELAH